VRLSTSRPAQHASRREWWFCTLGGAARARRLLGREFLQGGTCVIVAGFIGPPCLNGSQARRRVKSPGADGDPARGEPRLPEERGAAFLAEGVSRFRHGVEPSQVRIFILDLQVSDIGGCGGHMVPREAPAPVAMAVEDVPEVSEDLEGNRPAKTPPRGPGCRVHALPPPRGRLSHRRIRRRSPAMTEEPRRSTTTPCPGRASRGTRSPAAGVAQFDRRTWYMPRSGRRRYACSTAHPEQGRGRPDRWTRHRDRSSGDHCPPPVSRAPRRDGCSHERAGRHVR
jgi:hypothetical protein